MPSICLVIGCQLMCRCNIGQYIRLLSISFMLCYKCYTLYTFRKIKLYSQSYCSEVPAHHPQISHSHDCKKHVAFCVPTTVPRLSKEQIRSCDFSSCTDPWPLRWVRSDFRTSATYLCPMKLLINGFFLPQLCSHNHTIGCSRVAPPPGWFGF